MAFRVFVLFARVIVAAIMSSGMAVAHEVQPAVADVTLGREATTLDIVWTLEAPVAGLDLEGVEDTNEADGADAYDRLRAMPPDKFAEEVRAAWPRISELVTLRADGEALPLDIRVIDIPEVGNTELPRLSTLRLAGPPVPPDAAVTLNWDASFGPLVIRQQGVENGYTDYLTTGGETMPFGLDGGSDQTATEAFVDYVGIGFDHIVPLGLDHILFVLGLFFLALRLGALLWQITAFTLAHTVTLALGATGVVEVPADIVEPLIAASIVWVGIENLFANRLPPWRPALVFGFGLLHGLGFASVLRDFGLGADHFVAKLVGFNLGVEFGQLAVIAAAFLAVGALFGSEWWYRRRIAKPVSLAIAAIAVFWVLERTGIVDPSGAVAPFAMLTEGGFRPNAVLSVAFLGSALLTLAVLVAGSDRLRDTGGALTSAGLFLAIVAAFTSGAWLTAILCVLIWIVALRLQALGGPEDAIRVAP